MIPQNCLVLEGAGENVAAALSDWLTRHPLSRGGGQLTLLTPRWCASPTAEPERLPPCSILLLPGTAGPLAARFQTGCAVSYGSAARDSITISSIEGERLAVAVQRELPTVHGGAVEEQELVLPARHTWSPLPALAVIGTLLLLGVPPEQIMDDPPFS